MDAIESTGVFDYIEGNRAHADVLTHVLKRMIALADYCKSGSGYYGDRYKRETYRSLLYCMKPVMESMRTGGIHSDGCTFRMDILYLEFDDVNRVGLSPDDITDTMVIDAVNHDLFIGWGRNWNEDRRRGHPRALTLALRMAVDTGRPLHELMDDAWMLAPVMGDGLWRDWLIVASDPLCDWILERHDGDRISLPKGSGDVLLRGIHMNCGEIPEEWWNHVAFGLIGVIEGEQGYAPEHQDNEHRRLLYDCDWVDSRDVTMINKAIGMMDGGRITADCTAFAVSFACAIHAMNASVAESASRRRFMIDRHAFRDILVGLRTLPADFEAQNFLMNATDVPD